MVFEVRDLSFAYPGGKSLLQNLTFSLAASDRVLLRGDNGSGKSTLLLLLMGILAPSSGSVKLNGQESRKLSADQYRGVIYSGQSARESLFGLVPRHDIELWRLAAFGRNGEIDLTTLDDPLAAKLDTPYTSLSGGEMRACANLLLPFFAERFWLLDEPTVGLDTFRQQRFAQICAERAANGGGMLIVSHDPALAEELFDRFLLLENGRLRELK